MSVTKVRERPILFSAPMVRAILDGSKTQTRRVLKPRKDRYLGCELAPSELAGEVNNGEFTNCPYGRPGDQLWVREAFDFLPAGGPDEPNACEIVYWATGSHEPRVVPPAYNPLIYGHEKVRPSIHMPRWASRITLDIAGVRGERLRDISEEDARAEGARECDFVSGREVLLAGPSQRGSFVLHYRDIWEQINGPESWTANPWVWVISFRVLP